MACDEPEPGFFALLASEVAADFGIGDELHGSGDAFEAVRAQLGEDMLKQVTDIIQHAAAHAYMYVYMLHTCRIERMCSVHVSRCAMATTSSYL